MDVRELLEQVKSGGVNIEEAEKQLKNLPYEDLGICQAGPSQELRSGFGGNCILPGKAGCVFAGIYKKFYERDGEFWEPGLLRSRLSW